MVVNQTRYFVSTCSNSTVSSLDFNQTMKRIRFNVEGADGNAGFCNITIPVELLSGNFSVYIDYTSPLDYELSSNSTHNTLSITYEHSIHIIEVYGTSVIPDFASWLFLPFLMLATLSAIALKKRFRK